VITAAVIGPRAGNYEFTSTLPLNVLRLLAPAIEDHLRASGDDRTAVPYAAATRTRMAATGSSTNGD